MSRHRKGGWWVWKEAYHRKEAAEDQARHQKDASQERSEFRQVTSLRHLHVELSISMARLQWIKLHFADYAEANGVSYSYAVK